MMVKTLMVVFGFFLVACKETSLPSNYLPGVSLADKLSVSDVALNEGSNAEFVVSLPNPAPAGGVSFTYSTENGSFVAGTHFTSSSGTGTIPAGATSTTVSVPTLQDLADDSSGTFKLRVSSATGTATVTDATQILDFTTGVLPAGVNFSRASAATFVDAAGTIATAAANAARYDYDPVALTVRGLLMEPAATNLVTNNRAITHQAAPFAFWGGNLNVTSTAALAPDGSLTASRIAEVGGVGANQYFIASDGYVLADNTIYTASSFVKAGTLDAVDIFMFDKTGADGNVVFTLTGAGSVSINANGVILKAGIQQFPGGWYRTFLTFNSKAGAGAFGYFLKLYDTGAGASWYNSGAGGRDVYTWGWQIEAGQNPTSFIPTAAANATRSADIAYLDTGSWYNSGAFTAILDFARPIYETAAATTLPLLKFLNNGSAANDYLALNFVSATPAVNAVGYSGGALQASSNGAAGVWTANQKYQVAMIKSGTSLQQVDNGNARAAAAMGAVPSLDKFYLGGNETNGSGLHLKKFSFRPRAVSAAQAQAWTTR